MMVLANRTVLCEMVDFGVIIQPVVEFEQVVYLAVSGLIGGIGAAFRIRLAI